jgi:hypothetical protein
MIRMLILGYVFAVRSERRLCAEVRGKADILVFNYAHTAAKSRLQVTRNGRDKRELVLANNALGFAAKHECRH